MNQSLVSARGGAMLGAVHVDERLDVDPELPVPLHLRPRQQHRVLRVPEERVVALDLRHVGVTRDGAKRDEAVDRDERQWIVPPQALGRGVPGIGIGVRCADR